MSRAADALGVARVAAAVALPGALRRAVDAPPDAWPLVLFGVAAGSDFLDGAVARRWGTTRHGAVLDNVADVTFVLAASATGAALGVLSWVAPAAIAVAFATYAVASLRPPAPRAARTSVGHAAGVANYALAGLVAGAVSLPAVVPRELVGAAGLAVAALNLAAVAQRAAPRAITPARCAPDRAGS